MHPMRLDAYQGPNRQLCLEQGIIEAQQQATIDHVVHELLPVLAEAKAIHPVTYVVHCGQEVWNEDTGIRIRSLQLQFWML